MKINPANIYNKNYRSIKPKAFDVQITKTTFCSNPIKGITQAMRLSAIGLSLVMFHPSALAQDASKAASPHLEVANKDLSKTIPKMLKDIIGDYKIIEKINFRGGKSFELDSASVEKLKQTFKTNIKDISYSAPIVSAKNVYLCNFGMFGAPRPGGRPHMGLDIFVTPYAKKPQKPVTIQSPVDGVVISSKKANDNDNVIANSITVLGVDSREYAFDHMASAKDYPKAEIIELPSAGQVIRKEDSIGYVGDTGETVLWHLHFEVRTEDGLKKQLADKKLVALSKKSEYTTLKGQVDPLDEKSVGEIAGLMHQYKKVD